VPSGEKKFNRTETQPQESHPVINSGERLVISGLRKVTRKEKTRIPSRDAPALRALRATALDQVVYRERKDTDLRSRWSAEADPVWRIFAAASVAAIYRTLPRGAQPSGQRQSDLVSFAVGGKEEHGSSAVSTTGAC